MNYYNEHDLKAAAWLRELINQGLIPAGDVDTRSIVDVRPADLTPYTQCHFFAGIGGWSYALQLAGVPATTPLWTGSCPCQPFSSAGKGLGDKDERHLWPVFFYLISQCQPEHVFGEQVASAIGHGWLDGISADLEAEGYACGATVLGAHSVSAPHQRQRLYWVANHHHQGSQGRECGELPECAVELTSGASGACSGLDDARRPSDERRGESGDVGRSAGEEQRETRQRERGGDANSDPVQNDCGLVLPNGDGCSAGSSSAAPTGHGDTTEPAGSRTGWVGNSNIQQTYPAEPGQQVPSERLLRCWDASQLVHCRDRKTRRIPTEPAFFPLAHGVPARVVRLRGYGNAIVPQVAAEFIQAFYETQQPPHADWI